MMKTIISKFAGIAFAVSVAFTGSVALAAGDGHEDGGTPHYPINKPHQQSWSFGGPFGKWDLGQLQRGFKVYQEVCAACHSMDLVAFRNLETLGFTEDQIKAIAAEYDIEDGPNEDGEMFDRPGKPSDRIPGPYANSKEAASANNGAVPPDFSLLAKARAPERGFPTFVFDVFTLYAENGPDYIYSLLTGYQEPPAGVEVNEGTYYNPYFIAGETLAMANQLSEGVVTYDDGSPETVDQYARDVSAFMMWAAEPHLVERKQMGFMVMVFLAIFTMLLYLSKKRLFADKKD